MTLYEKLKSGLTSPVRHRISAVARNLGANGFFFEVHPEPAKALSDGANMITSDMLRDILKTL